MADIHTAIGYRSKQYLIKTYSLTNHKCLTNQLNITNTIAIPFVSQPVKSSHILFTNPSRIKISLEMAFTSMKRNVVQTLLL